MEKEAAVYLGVWTFYFPLSLSATSICRKTRSVPYIKMSRYTHPSALSACICLLLFCTSTHASASAPAHSPEAHTELICHTSHASECYPAIFQPTEYFQRIHDDQSIPPGLHVRLNLATGLKEARLNVPEPDDAPKADLVIIDNTAQLPNVGEQAPNVDSGQKVLAGQGRDWQGEAPVNPGFDDPFVPLDESDESNYLLAQKAVLGSTSIQSTLSAIEFLTGLAHDLEWEITLARDADLSRTLVHYVDPLSVTPLEVRSASAQLLGTAIQNNAEALEALLAYHIDVEYPQNTPIMTVHAALKASMTKEEQNIIFQKRLLFLLTNLSPSLPHLQAFVSNGGLTTLLELFGSTEMQPGVDGRGKIRMKVADYLQDHIISTIDGWPGHSLLEALPPGTSSDILGSQSVWKEAMRGMESWCKAFKLAFERYGIAAEAPGGASMYADDEYKSVCEAHEMLERALQNHGCEGECGCDFGKTFATIAG